MENKNKTSLVDLLLRPELPDVMKDLPTKEVEVPRLSHLLGEPAVFALQGLPYGRVQELQRMTDTREVEVLLAGCPQLRDKRLLERWNVPTYADAVKRFLLPGEINDLSVEVEKLCGYRMRTIREVKNA